MAFYKWMDRIEARPGMYLGRPDFDCLKAFISGYEMALTDNRIDESELPPFAGFDAFVRQRLGRESERSMPKPASAGLDFGPVTWEVAIADAAGDDRQVIELFFRLLHEYRGANAGLGEEMPNDGS
jgi:hypothetical protein